MKALLGSLLCLVLFSSECFAIKGGPPYPVGSANIMGTYGGVLQPAFDPTDPFSSNSLGVFSLSIPTSGSSTGTFIMFSRGRIFNGTIQGETDPNKGIVSALLDASFDYTLQFVDSTGTVQMIPVTASVTGTLTAAITSSVNVFASSSSSALLTGSAIIFTSNGGVQGNGDPTIDSTTQLSVLGFQQSATATASTTGTTGTGTGGG